MHFENSSGEVMKGIFFFFSMSVEFKSKILMKYQLYIMDTELNCLCPL